MVLRLLNSKRLPLFDHHDPSSRSIAAKSRRRSIAGGRFTKAGIKQLDDGITEPTNSWGAQVLFSKNPKYKNKMMTGYSQKIEWSTELDAYTLLRYKILFTLDLKSTHTAN